MTVNNLGIAIVVIVQQILAFVPASWRPPWPAWCQVSYRCGLQEQYNQSVILSFACNALRLSNCADVAYIEQSLLTVSSRAVTSSSYLTVFFLFVPPTSMPSRRVSLAAEKVFAFDRLMNQVHFCFALCMGNTLNTWIIFPHELKSVQWKLQIKQGMKQITLQGLTHNST